MTGTTDRERHDGERPVEHRLRQALAARADEVTVIGLGPADPPGPHLRRLSVRALWRRRSTWALVGLSGLAAAALAGYLVLGPDAVAPRPVPPAAPPELTSPSPNPSPPPTSTSKPTPSPSRPSTSPAPGGAPSPSATPSGLVGPSRMPPSATAGAGSAPTPSRAPATTPANSVPPSTTSPSAAKPFPTPSSPST
ncbi:hypothetical protein AB0D46_06755 [Streptomyces sp. NPDC048383]|uniref:hypothetical protein n=1 Tax=Streptomyces sp. NPDC048383 TaxID=3155386 RepID=UPI0034317E3A